VKINCLSATASKRRRTDNTDIKCASRMQGSVTPEFVSPGGHHGVYI
jgi:hypothetical protein